MVTQSKVEALMMRSAFSGRVGLQCGGLFFLNLRRETVKWWNPTHSGRTCR
jgi:hypothetical protein